MNENSPNLTLPYIMPAQAQKHVTHNEAIRALDALVQLCVISRNLTGPPGSPADGERHIVASPAIGDWLGNEDSIAAYQDGAWMFYTPQIGWLAWIEAEEQLVVWDGATWTELTANVNPVPLVGVNATADATNRLAVASPASLFNHEGAGHQMKINKAAAGDTASLVFQTGFAGRAEYGLTGDDDFHVKVSGDGSAWHEGLLFDRATGRAYFPLTPAAENLLINPAMAINQRGFAGGSLAAGAYGFDRWKAGTGGCNVSVSGETITLASGVLVQVVEAGFWGALAGQQLTFSVDDPSANLTIGIGASGAVLAAGSGRRKVTVTLGAGETGNIPISLSAAASVTFSRPKLEFGREPHAFRARPQDRENDLCQRYFERKNFVTWEYLGVGFAFVTSRVDMVFSWDTLKRANPTLTITGNARIQSTTSDLFWATGSELVLATPRIANCLFRVQATAGTFTEGGSYAIHARDNVGTDHFIDIVADSEL